MSGGQPVGRAVRRDLPPRRPRPTSTDDLKATWTCKGCGAHFTTWAAAQRHSGQPQHRRIELDL